MQVIEGTHESWKKLVNGAHLIQDVLFMICLYCHLYEGEVGKNGLWTGK